MSTISQTVNFKNLIVLKYKLHQAVWIKVYISVNVKYKATGVQKMYVALCLINVFFFIELH